MKRLEIVDIAIFLQGILTIIYLFGYDEFPILEENTSFVIIGLIIIGLGMYFMTYLKEDEQVQSGSQSQEESQEQEPQQSQEQQEQKHPHPLPHIGQKKEQQQEQKQEPKQQEPKPEPQKDVFSKFNEIKGEKR